MQDRCLTTFGLARSVQIVPGDTDSHVPSTRHTMDDNPRPDAVVALADAERLREVVELGLLSPEGDEILNAVAREAAARVVPCVLGTEPHAFDEASMESLRALAREVVDRIESRRPG